MPCRRRGSDAPAEDSSQIEEKLSTPVQTTTFDSLTALSSPLLIDTVVTTSLIGITTASLTTSATSSPPTQTTPLLGENTRTTKTGPESPFSALTKALSSLPASTQILTCTNNVSPSGNSSSSQTSSSSSRLCQSHVLTLPLIDEDDEDESIVKNRVQNDNLINLNADIKRSNNVSQNYNNELSTTALPVTQSPKIKVSLFKSNQSIGTSLSSSDSDSSVTTIHQQTSSDSASPKMQAESGTLAELQKYQNIRAGAGSRGRRHTLANAAINLHR